MENIIIEHPHINPLYETKPVQYIFMSLGNADGLSSPPLGYLKLDISTGEKQQWYAPLHTYCEELIVIPKKNDGSDGDNNTEYGDDEDDVWLLGCMYDAVEERSVVGIFDGKDITQGPICRVWLKHHLPHSLHGCFTRELFI
jgi:carotenoid cleavage dioxygenase-like enzyme